MAGFFQQLKQRLSGSAAAVPSSVSEESSKTLFHKALQATRQTLASPLAGLFSGDNVINARFWDDLEEALIQTDMGLDTAVELVDSLRNQRFNSPQEAINALHLKSKALLVSANKAQALEILPNRVNVILVVGVNGAGKTTFIGKLAHQCKQQGLEVVIGAGDTFRAAAEDQLAVWAERARAHLIRLNTSDPAAVMHETLTYAREHHTPVVILDTAGRLHNQQNLMAELEKINQTIDKLLPEAAVRENLLVLDATTGQNGLRQAEIFNRAVPLTGVVLTKLDGSAKGGIALAVAKTYGLPIKAVGVGEGIADLIPFDADDYLNGLLPSKA